MLELIQSGRPLNFRQRLSLTAKLSWPAIMAQLSSILMQYIDAAMVGRLGADDSAAVGLVSTSLWLFWGICSAATTGFSVQIAHRMGAADTFTARKIFRQGLLMSVVFGIFMGLLGLGIAGELPHWLGGKGEVCNKATLYFSVFVAALPLLTLNYLGSGALRASGNMLVPGSLNVMMCILDVLFNMLLIFPTRDVAFLGSEIRIPGAGLGVLGAALGTVAAEIVTAGAILWYACFKQKGLAFKGERGSFRPTRQVMRNAFKVAAPMTLEHAVICGAQIMVTVIVAPLGVMAIAANSFAVTAEALCYMPGYGIADAATTLSGQSYGAKRKDLAKEFGYLTVGLGMVVMSVMGVILWLGAPPVMELLTPVKAIQDLGVSALRIEAWAEPMFAASIVAYGVMVGVGDTIVPAIMNFSSIWLVRVPLAALMVGSMGLDGVWLAMCIELCFRGGIFLWRLLSGAWLRHGLKTEETDVEKEIIETDKPEELPPSY
ncbi:MAG: MATE family efflux transporter [Muribaculaceae bacterium]|nr:MATE family efflux transporter [Muribaculaceae bacterium]